MATTATLSLPTTPYQATLNAVTFRVTINDDPPANLLASVKAQFRAQKPDACDVVMTLTNGNGITITDAAAWEFQVDEIKELTLPVGYYVTAFHLTDSEGRNRKWANATLNVIQTATRD